MKKYAVYLFDGTNQSRAQNECKDWSNIVRLHEFLTINIPSDNLLDMYGEGVGCRQNEMLLGSTVGIGLDKRIEEAYYDLGTQVDTSRKSGDDLRIYVFGFSRGAYAARLFCKLVNDCGVPTGNGSFDDAMNTLEQHKRNDFDEGKYLRPPKIELLGVFDTVKMTDFLSDIDIMELPDIVQHACHAMSYHERRRYFPLTRFVQNQSKVEEVWFAGSHTDIGGGYIDRGLADHSLAWMVDKANEYGLPIKVDSISGDRANHISKFNDSTSGESFTKLREMKNDDLFHLSVGEERALFVDAKPAIPDVSVIKYAKKTNTDTSHSVIYENKNQTQEGKMS